VGLVEDAWWLWAKHGVKLTEGGWWAWFTWPTKAPYCTVCTSFCI